MLSEADLSLAKDQRVEASLVPLSFLSLGCAIHKHEVANRLDSWLKDIFRSPSALPPAAFQ